MSIDKQIYTQGESVDIDLLVENTGEAEDVIVNATVKQAVSEEVVEGLLLRNLHELRGLATFSLEWDSSGFESGDYYVEVELIDSAGNLLDSETQPFELGITSGEVTSFNASPRIFDVGDTINISMIFSNMGTVPISGTAVIRVQAGEELTTTMYYTQSINNLAPGNWTLIEKAWDTTGAIEENYRILGYVQYESISTEPESIDVSVSSTKPSIYLPLIVVQPL